MAFQRVQAANILYQATMAIGEVSFGLGVLPSFLPISLHNLLSASSDGFRC
jgi:hypothetical protein